MTSLYFLPRMIPVLTIFCDSSVVEQLAVNIKCFMSYKDKRQYADRADYLKIAVAKRRQNLRLKAIDYKGGRCVICAYNRSLQALDFHHLNPSQKDFGISAKGYTRSWVKVKEELDKCVLLCANCHREIHDGITQLP